MPKKITSTKQKTFQQVKKSSGVLDFIDVFSGCGGLSFGLELAGHKCVAAIDFDEKAIVTFNSNHLNKVGLCKDLLRYKPTDLEREIGKASVDMVVGGPPCQGFSTARRVDGGNIGPIVIPDSRRDLYKVFLSYVEHFSPKIFMMENVLGIRSTSAGKYFTAIQNEARNLGYNVVPIELKCWDYGVPQNRIRQIFLGTKIGNLPFSADLYLHKTHSDESAQELAPLVTLGEAIGDLPSIEAGKGTIISAYDMNLRVNHIQRYGDRYTFKVLRADQSEQLIWHVARPHSARDLRDFSVLAEGETSKMALKSGKTMEFPYSRDSFKDRFTRQSRDKLCSTIVAHLSKDGLMFIHPTQLRTLTPREAARVQSFPDTFYFHGDRSAVYKQIGNAVPPEAAKALGKAISSYITDGQSLPRRDLTRSRVVVRNSLTLLESIIDGAETQLKTLRNLGKEEFLRIWSAVHIVKPSIHPDNAESSTGGIKPPSSGTSLVLEPYYLQTGWPIYLLPIAREAKKRLTSGQLSIEEYYFHSLKIK